VSLVLALIPLVLAADGERAPAAPQATFALVVGVNRSVDAELAPLRYADDDAARYQDLFRLLGARTYLLSRFDEGTRRLHPQAAAEAREPVRAELRHLMDLLSADVARAAAQNVVPVVYVVYAGHGNVRDGEGYISLEDARLGAAELKSEIVERLPGAFLHFIVDACHSSFLAYERGPGGKRRVIEAFSPEFSLGSSDRVGLLLSTGSSRESHEWEGFQSGVFSHEVRSGLFGAADADGDGQVSYREIAAFIDRANQSIPNERFRPDVYARAPSSSRTLVTLESAMTRRLEVDGSRAGRYLLETADGVRLANFHTSPGQRVSLIRPRGLVYLRNELTNQEYEIASEHEVVSLANLPFETPRAASRGAAHQAFSLLFALPFDSTVVEQFDLNRPITLFSPEPNLLPRRLAYGALGVGAASVLSGAALSVWALSTRGSHSATPSGAEIARANQDIARKNTAALFLYSLGGALLATGGGLLLFGRVEPGGAQAVLLPAPGGLVVSGAF
jgi:hypothetical protein